VTSAGGASAEGGRTGSGGSASTGGRSGTGGESRPASGGRNGAGGRRGSGGSTGSAGAIDTGGTPATGGSSAAGGATGRGGASGSSHVGKWQIMPLGDSITGTTCYPKLLSQKLIENGHDNFTFVGTVLNNQSCGSSPNVQTEGHGGYLVTYLTTDSPPQSGKGKLSELLTWAAEKPEVVLMEYGTNDAWSSVATSKIIDAHDFVVDEFRKQNPSVIFFVAQITPLNPSGCASCEANVEALNAAIPPWAASKSTAASPIYVVDIWSALPAAGYKPNSTYTSDGCHPNPAGSQLMADKWYEGLIAKGIP
jgi:lysophospholipase L1-like esterase